MEKCLSFFLIPFLLLLSLCIFVSCDSKELKESEPLSADLTIINYVVVGNVRGSNDGAVVTSNNSNTWTLQQDHGLVKANAVTYGDGRFVIAGGDEITTGGFFAVSPDGITWSSIPTENKALMGIAYGDGKFVAPQYKKTGIIALVDSNYSRFIKSGSSDTSSDTKKLIAVAYGNDKFILVGLNLTGFYNPNNKISEDKTSFTPFAEQEGAAAEFYAIAYGAKRFVAVGEKGRVRTFIDGETFWADRSAGLTEMKFNGISYGNGRFVIVGEKGTVFISSEIAPKKIKWSKVTFDKTADTFNGVAYRDGKFIIVSEEGRIFTLVDGTTLTERYSDSSLVFRGVGVRP